MENKERKFSENIYICKINLLVISNLAYNHFIQKKEGNLNYKKKKREESDHFIYICSNINNK